MNVKLLMIIGLMLAVLAIGTVSASEDGDMLANESASIVDEVDENCAEPNLHNDSDMEEIMTLQSENCETDVIPEDSRQDVNYTFLLDVSDDYVVGTENILMVSLPSLSNECILTLDTSNNVRYNFHHGGLGWMINIGEWNITPGNHTMNLTYPGDDEYKPFTASIDFTCTFIRTSISDEMVYPKIALTFAKDATGKIQIFVDEKSYMNRTVEEFRNESDNGFPRYEPIYTYYAYLDGLNYGSHSYRILYTDDEKYVLDKPISGKFNVTYYFDVVEIDTNGSHYAGDEVRFGIFAPDDVKKIIVDYNGKSIEAIPDLDDYYDAIVTISDLKVGENNITFTTQVENNPSRTIIKRVYMNPLDEPQEDNGTNGTIIKNNLRIAANDFKVTYCDGTKYKVKLYGNDGKTKVTFLIDGKLFKTVTANSKGIASVKITKPPGTYKITAKALGKSVTKKLVVGHILKLKIIKAKSAKKITVKAILAKIKGKYLKDKKIILKVNGKKYTAKTDKKGIAKFTIKKFKSGKIKFQATYLKDTIKYVVKV